VSSNAYTTTKINSTKIQHCALQLVWTSRIDVVTNNVQRDFPSMQLVRAWQAISTLS